MPLSISFRTSPVLAFSCSYSLAESINESDQLSVLHVRVDCLSQRQEPFGQFSVGQNFKRREDRLLFS